MLGMVNHLRQYLPHLSTVTKPLNDLLKKDSAWSWGYEQDEAFTKIKAMVTSAPTLAYFDPNKPTTVSADASSYGIGGVLMQVTDGKQHPVAFCSRTLTVTEEQCTDIARMPGVCLDLREMHAISSWPRIILLDHGPQALSATYR